MFRRTILVAAVAAITLAACGDDDAESPTAAESTTSVADELTGDPAILDAVTVAGEQGAQPDIEFEQPFQVEESARKVLREGDGDRVEDGSTAILDFVMVNGRDGSVVASSYPDPAAPDAPVQPAVLTMDDAVIPGVRLGVEGIRAGSRVAVAIAPDDAFGPTGGNPQAGLEADDSLIMVADVREVRTPLERATGTPVEPAADLPTVELADDGAPTITVPEGEPPSELVAQTLIEGDGPEVGAGQTITVHYTGVLWDTGEVFDSSWQKGAPATFRIGAGEVISGWDDGLVGKTVGSQVLLVVPPAAGYPDGNASIPPDSTLVFVVDILDSYGDPTE